MSVWQTVDRGSEDVTSLKEVMSEQLASELSEKEVRGYSKAINGEKATKNSSQLTASNIEASAIDDHACEDDELIAQMLQNEYDHEYDQVLRNEEKAANRDSKISVNYSKYRVIPDIPFWQEDDSDEDDRCFVYDDPKCPIDLYEAAERAEGPLPKCGYRRNKEGQIITKHDQVTSQRSNGKRLMEFPPGIETGDGAGMDMQISNAVFNKIRSFSLREGKRKNKIKDKEDKSTAVQAVDQRTRLILFKMTQKLYTARKNVQGRI